MQKSSSFPHADHHPMSEFDNSKSKLMLMIRLDFQQIDNKLNNMMSYMNSFFQNLQQNSAQEQNDPTFAQMKPSDQDLFSQYD